MNIALHLVRETLAFIVSFALLFSSFSHIGNPYAFLDVVYDYGFFSPAQGQVVAAVIPSFSLAAGLSILIPNMRRTAAVLASFMFLVFVIAQTSVMFGGRQIECGCFGSSGSPVSYSSIGRTLVFLLFAIAVFLTEQTGTRHVAKVKVRQKT